MTELVVSFFLRLIERLGFIDKVKIKLLGTPDLANDKLVVALEETKKYTNWLRICFRHI
jgi:hypothetical protein